MTFEQDLEDGFEEFASEAGASATFAGETFQVTVSSPDPAQQQVDLALGRPYLVRIEVLRSVLPDVRPKVGESFDIGGVKYAIADILRHDPTDPTVVYVCRTTGKP